ncbi:hypothetical protein PIB30_078404, partial [Stylosanthes scabra]|nr:hypothetical protein [Stylosanthes scabra]
MRRGGSWGVRNVRGKQCEGSGYAGGRNKGERGGEFASGAWRHTHGKKRLMADYPFAFVGFAEIEHARRAISRWNRVEWRGNILFVSMSKYRREAESRGKKGKRVVQKWVAEGDASTIGRMGRPWPYWDIFWSLSRRVWIEVMGLPVFVWCKESLKRIVGLWGKEFGSEVYSVHSHHDLETVSTTIMEDRIQANSVVEETQKRVEDDDLKLKNIDDAVHEAQIDCNLNGVQALNAEGDNDVGHCVSTNEYQNGPAVVEGERSGLKLNETGPVNEWESSSSISCPYPPDFGPCTDLNHVYHNLTRTKEVSEGSTKGEKRTDVAGKDEVQESNTDDTDNEVLKEVEASKEVWAKGGVSFNESDDEKILARLIGRKIMKKEGASLKPRRQKVRRAPCLERRTLTTRTLSLEVIKTAWGLHYVWRKEFFDCELVINGARWIAKGC